MGRLDGKVALVTGGAGGIGRAIVERFVAEGAAVMIADLDAAAGQALAAARPDRTIFHRLDVTSDADWGAAIAALAARFGTLTTLVNNAGINFTGSIADASEADWRQTFDVNLLGPFLGCRHAVRVMAAGGGTIINMASTRGQRPSSTQAAYSASKAALLNLTQSTALHCGEQGLPVRCNAICPGVIETPLLLRHMATLGDTTAARRQLESLQTMQRIGQPEEVAAAAVFLASEESGFVTGTAINVDGGMAIR